MQYRRAVLALAIAAAGAVAACYDADEGGHTAIMGGSVGKTREASPPALTDARGRGIPHPRLPAGALGRVMRAGEENAVAVWIHEHQPMASSYAPTSGWSPPQPLETLFGEASDAQLVANSAGSAMAVWRHTVGSIQSLRFSRFEPAVGWSIPDVMPGALPRPPGQGAPPQLEMDAAGNVTAQWPSGFDERETQVSRYTAGVGWSRAISERLANAAPAPPSPRPAPPP